MIGQIVTVTVDRPILNAFSGTIFRNRNPVSMSIRTEREAFLPPVFHIFTLRCQIRREGIGGRHFPRK